jgi:putative glutamine amidotransferase
MTPRIGITACAHLADYLEAVRRAGGEPVVLAPEDGPARAVLAGLDGLLFSGGKDIDPAFYGEPLHPATQTEARARDEFELELARLAGARDLPRLGLCRGAQVLNVAHGGTLLQDIASSVPGALPHDVRQTPITLAHDVWVTRGSRLWHILQERLNEDDACAVNSRHHQSVARPAPGFDVVATAPDGVVEAIEHPAAHFCLGVQWHPENFWRTGEFRCLFEAFVEACRTGARASR